MVLEVLHSQQAVLTVNSQSGQCPGTLEARSAGSSHSQLTVRAVSRHIGSKVRGLFCFVSEAQTRLFNFPSNSLNINWLYVILQALFCHEISVWFSFFWISCFFIPLNKFIHFSFVSWVNRTLIYILRCLLCANTHCFLLTPLSLNGSVFIM